MQTEQSKEIKKVAQELVKHRDGVAMTGAGISVDSGIPDFRSSGGLWEKFDPMEYATIQAFEHNPLRVWKMLLELDQLLQDSKPNPGHVSLSHLEQQGVLNGIITQNVDNLHQEAGSSVVIEFHGNGRRLICPRCNKKHDAPEQRLKEAPLCECGSVLKPDVVFFGEMIPEQPMTQAMGLVESCKVMIVVGTSATVAPASLIPIAAKQRGAFIAEFNLAPTELTEVCDIAIFGSASVTLPLLTEQVNTLLK